MESLKEKHLERNIVFFDVCGTLYESNTTFDFVEFCFKDSRIFTVKKFFFRSYLGRFLIKFYNKLFKKDILRFYYISLLGRFSRDELTVYISLFFDQFLETRKIEVVWDLLSVFKKNDYSIVLVSASLDILISEVAHRIIADNYYATQLVFNEEICSGIISADLYGNKDIILSKFPMNQYTKTVFVTDNFNDINVSELVKDFIVISDRKHVKWWKSVLDKPIIYEK